MPIVRRYPGDIRAMGQVAQFGGEGAYRANVLNPLKTSDVNRSVSTQLSLLDMMEGARRANLQAQVSRSNMLGQLQQQQAQARFGRQSQERMAIYQNQQQMQRLQTQGRFQQQQAQAQFQRQRMLGQDRFGYQTQLGEQGFGFSEQLQAQQDLASEERQRALFRQAERSAVMRSLDPRGQAQMRTFDLQRKQVNAEKRFRPQETQQRLQQIDQEESKWLETQGRQPSLEEQFQQRGMWIDDPNSPGLQHYIGIDPKSGKLHKVIGGEPLEIEGGNVAEFYSTKEGQKKILDLATKDWSSQKDGTYLEGGALVPGRSFPDILNQYQRELGGRQFSVSQGTQYQPDFVGPIPRGGVRQAPPQQVAPPAAPNRQGIDAFLGTLAQRYNSLMQHEQEALSILMYLRDKYQSPSQMSKKESGLYNDSMTTIMHLIPGATVSHPVPGR